MSETSQNNKALHNLVVVIALLDWGLGHTTRSIAIIRHLIELGCNVIVACNSVQKALLGEELPGVAFVHLDGYRLKYSTSGWRTKLRLVLQIPKILTNINRENRWLQQFLQRKGVDLIISDSRFGFYAPKILSIFITHQLGIKSGMGHLADKLIRFSNYRLMNRFSHCWVPDFSNENNLAGTLSHPAFAPLIPVHYLGCVSRFEPCKQHNESAFNILIILSGPEPQRTLLENKILADVEFVKTRLVLVRGLPGNTEQLKTPSHLTVFNHLPTQLLNNYLCAASYVISRSGYTSVMDYMKIGARSILIPTPGQAEQEYLAQHLQQQGLALSIEQKNFSLEEAIQQAATFRYKKRVWNMEDYKLVINKCISSIAR